jgi:hypothetical protein
MELRIARLGKKRRQCLFGLLRRTYSRNHLDRRIRWALTVSRSARILKVFWQATGTVTYTDPDLCRTGLAQRVELARSQCGQIKISSWRLATF